MKIPLWCLLVLLPCLFTGGRGDCQDECVTCALLLQQQQLQKAFNTMVCLLECEGHVSSSLTWEVCKRAVLMSRRPVFPDGGALLKRMGEELQLTSLDLNSNSELLQSTSAEQDEDEMQRRGVQYDSSLLGSAPEEEVEEEVGEAEGEGLGLMDEEVKSREGRDVEREEEEDDGSEPVALSKRFGGFQRGRHGYRKFMASPLRPLQKRYGGFIGVRKSARKWNSQKRVNQLLRQYLGMRSSRSGRFNNIPVARVWRQNKL